MLSKNLKKSGVSSIQSEYYLVFINPKLHKKTWNTLRLILEIAESKYLVFHDKDINVMQLHPVDKDEYNSMYYNPN